MPDTNLDADLISLVVQLNMRIGMIMEDVSPVVLDPLRNRLKSRAREVACASAKIAALVDAAQALLEKSLLCADCVEVGHWRELTAY